MVNENKVKIMTKMAIYEKHNGKDMIKSNRYSKADYVLFGVLKSLAATSIGFAVLMAVVVAFNSQQVIEQLGSIGFSKMGIIFLVLFIIVALIMSLVSVLIYSYRYDSSRKELKKYYSRLQKLDRFYSSKK